MANTKYRAEIEKLVSMLSKQTNVEYKTNFAPWYGRWNLTSEEENGILAFDYRKESKEMIAYLRGALNGIYLARHYVPRKIRDNYKGKVIVK